MADMTPSKTMTDGQINKAVLNYRALLEKHSKKFDSETVQTVLGQPEFAEEMFEVFRRRVELIVRHVKFVSNRNWQQILDATKREQWFEERKNIMPTDFCYSGCNEFDVYFFKLSFGSTDIIRYDNLEKEYVSHNLEPAHPYLLSLVNELNPLFADKYPNCTPWKDVDGKLHFSIFYQWFDGERYVNINHGWVHSSLSFDWWFAGILKKSKT